MFLHCNVTCLIRKDTVYRYLSPSSKQQLHNRPGVVGTFPRGTCPLKPQLQNKQQIMTIKCICVVTEAPYRIGILKSCKIFNSPVTKISSGHVRIVVYTTYDFSLLCFAIMHKPVYSGKVHYITTYLHTFFLLKFRITTSRHPRKGTVHHYHTVSQTCIVPFLRKRL